MKYISFLFALVLTASVSEAKIWRINNTIGVNADFTTFFAAVASSSVAAGDTLYLEPSPIDYATNSITVEKRLVVIGPGYFLDPSNTGTPGNAGLQVSASESRLQFFRLGSGAAGSRYMGITIAGSLYFNGISNVTFERVLVQSGFHFENGTNNAVTFRKCFFNSGSVSAAPAAVVSNFVCENNIFYNNGYINLDNPTGTGNIFRNNSCLFSAFGFTLVNMYVANNIFGTSGQSVLTNSTIKNNFFQANQPLPGTATNNVINQDMLAVFVAGSTGSLDSRAVLKAGSPAIDAGLTVGSVVTPDCGAYGGTDPYKLSGIPNIPSIYSLTVPTSISSGSATMNITFSTRNNN